MPDRAAVSFTMAYGMKGYDDRILLETGLFKMDERGVCDKFWNRVMFPIMDVNNRVIGFWSRRVMGMPSRNI